MNDLSVTHELKCHQPRRAGDIEFAHAVVVTFDCCDDEAFHLADLREPPGNFIRDGEIQCKAPGPAADLCGDGLGLGLVATGDHYVVSASREDLRDLSSKPRSSPYNYSTALVRQDRKSTR